ncbi:DUF2029 domain-containing protein [bacterium]|nr:DUF2029 domain-containing protein [Delftia acidovorans]MBN9523887.1 DUF2029 domain-containing protein [bacterium]
MAASLLLLAVMTPTGPTPGHGQDAPTLFPARDFIEYWSAARVFAAGGDPYDGSQLLPHQRVATGDPDLTRAVMLWTPPWTLPLYLPLGLLGPRPAHLLWLAVQLGAVLVATRLLWRVYRGRAGPESVSWTGNEYTVGLTFAPTIWMLAYGQNTGLILLGIAGFVYLRTRGYPVAAGAVVALTAIKPHLLALFGLALVLDATTRSGRRVLAGGVGTLAVVSALAWAVGPGVFPQFVAGMTRPSSLASPSVTDWPLPLLSYQLRVAVDPTAFGLQFLPVGIGAGVLIGYWWVRRGRWDWPVEAPRLVLASVLVAPYGGWLFDLTVLLVPVSQALAVAAATRSRWYRRAVFSGLLALSLLCVTVDDLADGIWFAPAVLGWYCLVIGLRRPAPADR